jgi:hypothetical protein
MGVSGQGHVSAEIYPRGKFPRYPLAGWTSKLDWTQRLEEKLFAPAGEKGGNKK